MIVQMNKSRREEEIAEIMRVLEQAKQEHEARKRAVKRLFSIFLLVASAVGFAYLIIFLVR